ncbi:hypothetical protein DXG03_004374 [Asterophora parasitica]|uniref:Uncharacterized protein n=1 Tax=Asterophora parasitica TaxID=117018 RepID=A0A9P7GF18_9AGAR|nr:hypothetical protein DXG03_004374 [Asterophora parasitica]
MPGGVGPGGGGITGWQDGGGIGSGLLKPGVHGSCLRRKVSGVDDANSSTGSGNTKLSELIPRFIRLSALVAVELAMEALDETSSSFSEDTSQFSQDWPQTHPQVYGAGFSTRGPASSSYTAQSISPDDKELALRPTREWYLLLAGLLTRAALEGYLTASWRGSRAVECLLTVGLGMVDGELEEKRSDARRFEEFEPDDMPTLLEATKLLFPSSHSSQRMAQSEKEYGTEMRERLRKFFDIPASTPDLSTHMEDLAWQYPAEPIERAAVRFCEAISKWRGKPELETVGTIHFSSFAPQVFTTPQYKKPTEPPIFGYAEDHLGSLSLPMESLVHSNPPTPAMANATTSARVRRPRRKPSIGDYFTQPPPPPPLRDGNWSPNKRRRSPDPQSMYGSSPSKRLNTGS